jgi:hypothetical protein
MSINSAVLYQTEPEPGLDGRSVFQPRGKVQRSS